MYEGLPLWEIIMNSECGMRNAELRGEKDKEISPDPPCESAFFDYFFGASKK